MRRKRQATAQIETQSPMNALTRFILKYKILHIAYWLWASLGLIHQREQYFKKGMYETMPDVVIMIGTQMLCVYTCIYVLIPRLLNKSRYLLFTGLTLLLIVGCSFLSSCLQSLYTLLTIGRPLSNFFFITFTQSIDMVVVTSVFIAIVVISQRYREDQKRKELEKEKLETELSFLKSQINPHFLFNALNSIYVLIDIDKKVATETLLRFSGLLRYQLYECSEKDVDIESEMKFLNDYIWLEKMRNGDTINVDVQLKTNGQFRIAPFMLIPFFENAFKHVSRYSGQENRIGITCEAGDSRFSMSVSNTYNDREVLKENHKGIGLQNVKRRLELLYPDNHKLEIVKGKETFTVNLEIHGKQNEVPYSG